MGWNKQSGDAWVLQRTADKHTAAGEHDKVEKMLQLRVLSLMTIADAEKLALAILDEVHAAAMSDGKVQGPRPTRVWVDEMQRSDETREQWKERTFALHYGTDQDFASAVLDRWDKTLGVELYPWQRKIIEFWARNPNEPYTGAEPSDPMEGLRHLARRMEAQAWVNAYGDATPPENIATEVAQVRIDRDRHAWLQQWKPGPPANLEDDDGCPND